MNAAHIFTIQSDELIAGLVPGDAPLVFIDLDRSPEAEDIVLPPCPVIGVGDLLHPLAAQLDGVVEPPVSSDALIRHVAANPRAAATVTQLLRLLPDLPPESGLTAESMAYAMLQASAEHTTWRSSHRVAPAGQQGRVEVFRDQAELRIVLDRAETGNAIDRAMRDSLHDALMLASLDDQIERVSLRANGKAFSLGADLSEFGTTTDPATAHEIRFRTLPARQALACAEKLHAHVEGACVGAGLELAAFARRLTASDKAWFQLPELAMGILPGAGGCVSVTQRIGRQRAALMILSGKRLSARQALAWGLVDAIVDEPA